MFCLFSFELESLSFALGRRLLGYLMKELNRKAFKLQLISYICEKRFGKTHQMIEYVSFSEVFLCKANTNKMYNVQCTYRRQRDRKCNTQCNWTNIGQQKEKNLKVVVRTWRCVCVCALYTIKWYTLSIKIKLQNTDNENETGYFFYEFFTSIVRLGIITITAPH